MKTKHYYYIVSSIATLVGFYYFYCLNPKIYIQDFLMALTIGFLGIGPLVFAIAEIKRRRENGIDLFAHLETEPCKVKAHMLFIMQYGHHEGIVGAFNEFNDIFRNYPQWKLSEWEVFRAWYKNKIDHMGKYPDIYDMTMKSDGTPYDKERDSLYDPNAPDWAQFDRPHYYDDDDADDFDEKSPDFKKAAKDGFMMGIGYGIVNDILNN